MVLYLLGLDFEKVHFAEVFGCFGQCDHGDIESASRKKALSSNSIILFMKDYLTHRYLIVELVTRVFIFRVISFGL